MIGPDNRGEIPLVSEVEKGLEKKEKVNSGDYVDVEDHSGRCVDDRPDRVGENKGVQFLGGALHILDLMRMAIVASGAKVDEETLWKMTDAVFSSDKARENNILPGVHIDDDHGQITGEKDLKKRILGCGYDNVRDQVLARLDVPIGEYETGDNIRRAKDLGWKVQILTGHHHEEVTAAINFLHGKTLQTKRLWEEGRIPSFNHDIWAVRLLREEMASQLMAREYDEASEKLDKHGVDWSKRMYIETLDILSGEQIKAHDLIEIT